MIVVRGPNPPETVLDDRRDVTVLDELEVPTITGPLPDMVTGLPMYVVTNPPEETSPETIYMPEGKFGGIVK